MKSNNRKILVLILGLVVAGVLALFWWRPTTEKVATPLPQAAAPSPTATPAITSPPPLASQTPGSTQVVDPVYEKKNAERQLKVQQFFNAPIDFFGKVVDENDQPITGASTFYSVATASFENSPTYEGPKTDGAGLFSITGKRGPDLIVRVEHPGYYPTESADQKIEYAKREYMPGKEPPAPPTEGNPRIFVLKKKGTPERLLHYADVRARLPFNGSPVTFNLRDGKVESGGEAITITLQSTGDKLPLNTFRPFDWSATIQVSGGGLIERSNALDFQAPANGYVPQIEIKMPASLPRNDWKSSVQKDLFVSFGSGHYARVRLNISGDKGRSIAEVFFNPTAGSRNLEFDPNAKAQ